jgi:predicted nucleic-acid-binding protein
VFAERTLALLKGGVDFADGVIVHEGQWRGGQTFVSCDKQAVALLEAAGPSAGST